MKKYLKCIPIISFLLFSAHSSIVPTEPAARRAALDGYIHSGIADLSQAQKIAVLDAVFEHRYLPFLPTSDNAKEKLLNFYRHMKKVIKLQGMPRALQRPDAHRMSQVRDEWTRKTKEKWIDGREAHHIIPRSYCEHGYLLTMWWNIAPLTHRHHVGTEGERMFTLLFPNAARSG